MSPEGRKGVGREEEEENLREAQTGDSMRKLRSTGSKEGSTVRRMA